MRVLLVMPTPFENGRLGLENVVWLSEPVALTSVGTAIQGEHEVRVLDMRLEDEDALVKALTTFEPDVVGTTSMTTDAYQAKAVLRTTRNVCPNAVTIVGGHHPTLCPEEFDVDYVDVIVQGEGENTLREIMARVSADGARTAKQNDDDDNDDEQPSPHRMVSMDGVRGTRWRDPKTGIRHVNAKREQTTSLDDLPIPNRKLIARYQGRYFFTAFRPMASIFTSRGCSFDCNFCAIWEFYERRTRFLSAKKIVDQMEACAEPFVFVLDDNFLTNKKRVVALCEELEKRNIKKYWMTQGRTDFAAENPDLIARLAKNGLVMLLSGFESNDDDNLAALRKKSSWQKNLRANQVLRENGVMSTGIFMVRADWTKEAFEQLYEYVNSLDIGIPLFTILTPLPGTQLYRAYKDKLLTTDHRLFDLLHAVLPTRLPREEFYKEFSRAYDATEKTVRSSYKWFVKARPSFVPQNLRAIIWFYARSWRYQRIHRDAQSFLRDEEGLLQGPGAKAGLTWKDVTYPKGDEHEQPAPATTTTTTLSSSLKEEGKLVKLRIPRRIWADDIADARRAAAASGGE